jgi:hypothetical protein
VIAAAVVIAAGFIALLWLGAPWLDASRLQGLTPVQQESAIDAIRGRLLQLGAGLVIASGLVYTGLTFRLNREGHVTDRYTKAIDASRPSPQPDTLPFTADPGRNVPGSKARSRQRTANR